MYGFRMQSSFIYSKVRHSQRSLQNYYTYYSDTGLIVMGFVSVSVPAHIHTHSNAHNTSIGWRLMTESR